MPAKVKFAVSIVQKLGEAYVFDQIDSLVQKRQAHLQAADRQGKYQRRER